jgi:hypothetical protein
VPEDQVTATRGDRQREIEEMLHRFRGDAVESQDLLLAWAAGLEERYDLSQLADVMHEVKQLLDALKALDHATTSEGLELVDG